MKESFSKSRLIRMIVLAVLAAALYFLWRSTDSVVAKLFAMVFGMLFCVTLVSSILRIPKPESHRTRTILTITASLLRYVGAIVILCWGLSILGVDISAIVASVGILTLVVGFGAESLIADVITGTFMLFENQYNVGDIVEVNGFRGTVNEIGIRTTSIMDTGKNLKIINNSEMKNILNRSDNASIAVSDIDVPYETDLEDFELKLPALMEDIYSRHTDAMNAPPQYLGVQALGASGVTLRFLVEVPEYQIYSSTRLLNRDLLVGFKKLGVECPFPQVDVHSR